MLTITHPSPISLTKFFHKQPIFNYKMAASKTYYARPNHRFISTANQPIRSNSFELDESDIYNISISPESRKPLPTSRITKRSSSNTIQHRETASSLPVSVPDWSNILKQEYNENRKTDNDDEDVNRSDEDWIPPHEFLARTRMASFSVHEGIGRTLKGRDLSRVRNAVWKKIGFED